MNEHKRKRIQFLIIVGPLVGAMLLLASGLSKLQFRPGNFSNLIAWLLTPSETPQVSEYPELPQTPNDLAFFGDEMLGVFIFVFWVMLVFSIIFAFVSPKFRRDLVRMFAFVITMGLLVPYIMGRVALRFGLGEEAGGGDLAPIESPFSSPPGFIQQPPEWLFICVNVLILSALFGVIYFLWRRFQAQPDKQAVVVREVRQALSDLEAGEELRSVVIACYAKMCEGLQKKRSINRQHAMTPREFEHHLARAGITDNHIRQLTRLFESVRYGAKNVDQTTENFARQCLQVILHTYGQELSE